MAKLLKHTARRPAAHDHTVAVHPHENHIGGEDPFESARRARSLAAVASPATARLTTPGNEDDESSLPAGGLSQVALRIEGLGLCWGTSETLGRDAWGAGVLSLTRYLPVMMLKTQAGESIALDIALTMFAVVVSLANVTMQLSLLWYISDYIVEVGVRAVQLRYADFRARVFDEEGNFEEDKWHKYIDKGNMCELAIAQPIFYYTVLLLWVLTNSNEWRSIASLAMSVWHARGVASPKDMLVFHSTGCYNAGGTCMILGLTKCIRALVIWFVIIPRTLISLYLTYLGCRMLSASETYSDMVMNSLALGFVISIDDLLCHAFLPKATHDHLQETGFFNVEGSRKKTVAERDDENHRVLRFTILFFILALLVMLCYGELLQRVLPTTVRKVRWTCLTYLETASTPLCSKLALFGWNSACYEGIDGMGDAYNHKMGISTGRLAHHVAHHHSAHKR